MTPAAYIQSQLERLAVTPTESQTNFKNDTGVVDFIYASLMSKKFRKYSVPEINHSTIRAEIEERVAKQEPILIHYPFGGYKLWRFAEAPHPDWAELFALIYLVRWVKPVLAVYAPGVHFVFRFDEVLVEKLNNIPIADTEAYRTAFAKLLAFIQKYTPGNLEFEIFLERSRYESYEQFEKELAAEIGTLRAERIKNGHALSDAEKAMIDLNVRLKPGQTDDPNWREENDLIHIAYYTLQNNKKHPRKHYEHEGIVAFPFYFETPNIIPIGTTKTSVAKFWAGVGALRKRNDSYIEVVLSPDQLSKNKCELAPISMSGLDQPNFNTIRIID